MTKGKQREIYLGESRQRSYLPQLSENKNQGGRAQDRNSNPTGPGENRKKRHQLEKDIQWKGVKQYLYKGKELIVQIKGAIFSLSGGKYSIWQRFISNSFLVLTKEIKENTQETSVKVLPLPYGCF